MSSIDEIKSRIDIVDLVSEAGVKLRRAGRNHTGFCPFHSNTRTPAFVVWPETGTWRCFGECNEGGDIFKFVMKKEGVDFKEALRRLADRAGVKLEEVTPHQQEQREENDRLRTLLEDAVSFYRHCLIQSDAGKPALEYLLSKRSLTQQTVETFGLGYAPDSFHATFEHFKSKGHSEQDLLDAGLLSQRDDGSAYDRFRNRIMIPIRDENGKMAGFGARILDPNDVPKFLNSPETAVFTKGHLLYGLDRARKPIRAADQAVIVEGYLDVIALHQAGYENVISPMGTALTDDQLRLLKRFTRRIVLALDPDAAGQKAVLRGLDAARASMDREGELGFDARGLLRHEARLQADLRVASMPDGLDPDEIVARDREEWKRLIEAAKPIVEHVLDTLMTGRDVNEPKVKADIAAQVLPLIEDLPNPVERDSYRQMLARRLRVDERSLTATQAEAPRRRRPREAVAQPRQVEIQKIAPVRPGRNVESTCLDILIRRPELLYRLDRKLQEMGLTPVTSEDFGYTDHQLLLQVIKQSVEQDRSDPARFVQENLPDALTGFVTELLARAAPLDPIDDRLLEELLRGIIQLRRLALAENLNQLRFMQEDAQQQGDLRTTSYQALVLQHTRLLRDLDQAGRKLAQRRVE